MATLVLPSSFDRGSRLSRLVRSLLDRLRARRHGAVNKNAQETPIMDTPAPLASLITALRSLVARQQQLDHMATEIADVEQRKRIERWSETNLNAVEHLQRAIGALPASSEQEAAIQVTIALDRLTAARDHAEDRSLDDKLEVVQLLLRAAAPILADHAAISLADYGAEQYGRAHPSFPFFVPSSPSSAGGGEQPGINQLAP